MRSIFCGGTKAISQLDEKRKRLPISVVFRRRPKAPDDAAAASVVSRHLGRAANLAPAAPAPPAVPAPAMFPVPPPPPPAPAAAPLPAAVQLHPALHPAQQHPLQPPSVVPIDVDSASEGAGQDAGGDTAFDDEIKSACTLAVLNLFPDICPTFLLETSESLAYDYESIASSILDQVESGKPYPRRPALKRKRPLGAAADAPGAASAHDPRLSLSLSLHDFDDEDLDDERINQTLKEYSGVPGLEKGRDYTKLAQQLLQQAYPFVPHKFIATHLTEHDDSLLSAVLGLDTHIAEKSPLNLAFVFKKRRTPLLQEYQFENLPAAIEAADSPLQKDTLREYLAALKIRQLRRDQREAEQLRAIEEAANFRQAELDGTIQDCQCCFADVPLNCMVHCNGSMVHFFCKDCARRMAENQIGLSKYQLTCMSMDSCEAGFSHQQRALFLDKKTTVALERLEQEHVLRLADIENLETCPFCPFAAEYPPANINKEFTCQNPGCEIVSCRLCRKETHIPKTCQEVERERGPAARLTIEEAMSAAMIRNCNKCSTPFIKELGCNKMTCSSAGCGNVQCYVCHKSCDYSHFDDSTRGGKKGNCPLFESAEQRHEEEVQAAEARAREEVVKSHPDLDINLLKFELSGKVLDDENRRKLADQMGAVNNY